MNGINCIVLWVTGSYILGSKFIQSNSIAFGICVEFREL
jgi:hypothetical protein